MMIMTPLSATSGALVNPDDIAIEINKNMFLITELSNILPPHMRELTPEEEKHIGDVLTDKFGLHIAAELEGKRLNRSYGYIGAEQHLMRYPGDTISTHFSSVEEAQEYARSGMAPGRGAWGYFVQSYTEMTQKDIERENAKVAVQRVEKYSNHPDN